MSETNEMTLFSKRIYKNILNKKDVLLIQNILLVQNKAKHTAYRMLLNEHNYGIKPKDSLYKAVQVKFPTLNTYYLNSAIQDAKAALKSSVELNEQYIEDTKNKIKKAKFKVKDLNKKLQYKINILNSIIKGKIKFYKGSPESVKNGQYVVRQKKRIIFYDNIYLFEHQYLKPLIKRLHFQIKNVNTYILRLEEKLEDLENGLLKGVCFGSKKLFKGQFTNPKYIKNHKHWKKEFDRKRYGSMRISGRLDAAYGNYVFKYNHVNETLHFQLPCGSVISIPEFIFPYGQNFLDEALIYQNQRKKPIAWSIEDKGDYYIFKTTVRVPKNENINYYTKEGVIGVDLNADHFAWSETNKYGQLIDHGVLPFNLFGKTSGQITKIIEQSAVELVNIAKSKNKPLVLEELDTTKSKSKLRYGNKKANRKITQFAYNKMISSIKSRANKEGVFVFDIKPNYTSQIGKMKYMKQYGISIHTAASYVIARRQKFRRKEKLPATLKPFLSDKLKIKHHWSHWNSMTRSFKEVPTHKFYDLSKEKVLTLKDIKDVKKSLLA